MAEADLLPAHFCRVQYIHTCVFYMIADGARDMAPASPSAQAEGTQFAPRLCHMQRIPRRRHDHCRVPAFL